MRMTILAPAARSLRRPSRRVALYVLALLGALPLLAFTLAAVRAVGLCSVGVGFLLLSR
jgi:hypothetical protein